MPNDTRPTPDAPRTDWTGRPIFDGTREPRLVRPPSNSPSSDLPNGGLGIPAMPSPPKAP